MCYSEIMISFNFTGEYIKHRDLADIGQESSSVLVETTLKTGKAGAQKGPILPKFKSDASKVVSKGMGLKKAYLSKQNQFTVSAQDAGEKKFRKVSNI